MGIFDFLTGEDARKKQREDLRRADATAEARIATGRQEATGRLETGLESVRGLLTPDIETGDAARDQLMAALGLSGREAQQGFFDEFQTDPGFEAELAGGIEAIDRSAAARGMTLSGGNLRGLQQFGQRMKRSAFQERLDRLTQLSTVGTGARGAQASAELGTAGDLAGLELGAAQLGANRAISLGSAMAGTRRPAIEGITELVKVGAKIAGSFAGA